jgi:Domain of unknown function (DUF5666)
MPFLRSSPLEFFFVALFAAPVVSAPAALTARDIKARPASPQAMNFSLEGKITDQAAGKLTVSTEENIVFQVTYDEKTDIKYDDGAQGSGQNLRVGVHIKVDGELAESGDINARKIVIVKEQKRPASRGATVLPRFPTSFPFL